MLVKNELTIEIAINVLRTNKFVYFDYSLCTSARPTTIATMRPFLGLWIHEIFSFRDWIVVPVIQISNDHIWPKYRTPSTPFA
jgi:hypothetical protein